MQAEPNGASYQPAMYSEHMCYSDSEQPLGSGVVSSKRTNVRENRHVVCEKRKLILTKKSAWQRVQKQVQKVRKTARVLENLRANGVGDKKSQRSSSSLDDAFERASMLSLRIGSIGRGSFRIPPPSRKIEIKNPNFVKLSQDLSRWSTLQSHGAELIKQLKCLDIKPLSSNSKIEEESED